MEISLTELKNQIYYPKTREYFEEVEKSFYNENYRSAVVMLYSVVIADLLYKLEELMNYYSDKTAEHILDEINKSRKSNPKNSEWENKLIEKIKDQTNLLEPYVLSNIEDLKNVRNFSAHPSLDQNNELIRPSREKTLGLIKEMLNGIFIRPPLFVKKITDNMLFDISTRKEDFLADIDKFQKYIEKKYFERIPDNMLLSIFKDFWKLTFKLDNPECNENRKINLELLKYVMHTKKLKVLEDMQRDMEKYNNISDDPEIQIYLVEFIYFFPETYNYLNDQNMISIGYTINNNPSYQTIAYFTPSTNSIEEHIKSLNECNFKDTYTRNLLETKVREEGLENLLLDRYIDIYGDCNCFNDADYTFENLIEPNLGRMQQSQIERLLKKIDSNNQLYNRGKAEMSNNTIIKKSKINWEKISLNKYKNFAYDEKVLNDAILPF